MAGTEALPAEIDDHKKLFGKEPWEVDYYPDYCIICNTRVDEYGYCACGGAAD